MKLPFENISNVAAVNQKKIVLLEKFLAKIANPFITAARLSGADRKI